MFIFWGSLCFVEGGSANINVVSVSLIVFSRIFRIDLSTQRHSHYLILIQLDGRSLDVQMKMTSEDAQPFLMTYTLVGDALYNFSRRIKFLIISKIPDAKLRLDVEGFGRKGIY